MFIQVPEGLQACGWPLHPLLFRGRSTSALLEPPDTDPAQLEPAEPGRPRERMDQPSQHDGSEHHARGHPVEPNPRTDPSSGACSRAVAAAPALCDTADPTAARAEPPIPMLEGRSGGPPRSSRPRRWPTSQSTSPGCPLETAARAEPPGFVCVAGLVHERHGRRRDRSCLAAIS